MASASTMAGANVPDSRDKSLTPPPPEKGTTGKAAPRKTRQGGTAKNPPSLPTNKRTADQAFHDAPSEIVPDIQLQNEVANLECQVLRSKESHITETTPNPYRRQSHTFNRSTCRKLSRS